MGDAKWSGKRIAGMQLYRKVSTQGYEHLPFLILYCFAIYLCYQTIGEQYVEALSKAENLEINIIDPQERLRKTAESFLSANPAGTGLAAASSIAFTTAFFVPSQWIPGFWPSVFLGLVTIAHALLLLMQKWSIKFACFVKYRKEQNAAMATHAHVTPLSHLGKEELVKIERSIGGGIFFEFHRRKYLFDAKTNNFEKVRCKVTHPIEHYVGWRGIPNTKLFSQLRDLYGPNQFKMASPAFMDLYIAQITSPFTVFQIFCAILWLLDEYWKYALFNLFMICTFEATTVFTRLKSLSTLKGMGNEAHPVFVYREAGWVETSTEDLVPGDVFSVIKGTDDVVPCDALIITGSAVVNESSLTGESVPQMKDGLSTIKQDADQPVNIKGVHKANTLFGGTRILQVTGITFAGDDTEIHLVDPDSLTAPPDGGCVCYCVRTGFSSSQGKLVRMIENSTASVSGDVRDTVLLLLFLLIFAVSASGYVLYKGMQDGTKSRYQLLLHCILIVTSVIPPELPMQTALAVNSSLMTLMQMQVFCTEPFRVPIAGKVDTCVFDKTGTLTTDELVAVGIVPETGVYADLRRALDEAIASRTEEAPAGASQEAPVIASTAGMTSLKHASAEALLVLGACHSLVTVDGKVAGDPLEVASLKGIRWELVPGGNGDVSRPRPESVVDKKPYIDLCGRKTELLQAKIIARHHFSSKLQRMSVIATVPGVEGGFALVKGSPEAILAMCNRGVSADYLYIASALAKRGMRVIALAYKHLSPMDVRKCAESRNETECELTFIGWVSFTCRVRKDSGDIVKQLREGGCVVAMATGDAILTGVHVAREVGITTESKKSIKILEHDGGVFSWSDYTSGERLEAIMNQTHIEAQSAMSDLCVEGSVISAALDAYPVLETLLHHFVVFARMRPDEKERVLLALKDSGRTTLMMGDGANDVGALKQAHVGIGEAFNVFSHFAQF
jgi:cation-transporting ATPase 13A1